MALMEIRKDPSKRELAWFGLLMAAFFGIAGVIVRHRFDAPTAGQAVWIGGGALSLLYLAVPPLRRAIYLGWIYATYPIGWVVSHTLLAGIYYLVFTPIGLLLRLFGKDPMSRALEPGAASYWAEHRPCASRPARYFRQY